VGITRRPVAINQDLKALICGPRAHPDYIARIVKAAEPIVLNWVRATTADNFPIENLRLLKIPLPSLDEQRRIAMILDKADTLRLKRGEALRLIDQLGHALYRDSFGDPVSNPAKFPITTLGQLGVKMVYGPRFYNEEYSDEGVRIVRITDLSDSGELDFEAMPRLAVSEADLLAHQSRPDELLFARTGATVGKVAVISADDHISIPGAYFIRLRFPDHIEPIFAWYTLRCAPIQEIIAERSRQSAQQNFSGPAIRRLPFIVPKLDHQRAFSRCVKEIGKAKAHHGAQGACLESLFLSLQNRAFLGQL
jgi:type I restriction enzyme S subunit